ncbi:hypothetical protein FAZ69_28545 [Trinickia terrae]|uniref:Uncharacterized protein n=1 Tax=Trinickia terrae TaxID=2571161 RepID=A0A4U1HP96_9BURK|nr:hypothetical protein FAZ69_28545 [Trinickia terrae]
MLEHARTLQGSRALVLDGSILVVRFLGLFVISDAFLVFSAIGVQFGQVTGRAYGLLHRNRFAPRLCESRTAHVPLPHARSAARCPTGAARGGGPRVKPYGTLVATESTIKQPISPHRQLHIRFEGTPLHVA